MTTTSLVTRIERLKSKRVRLRAAIGRPDPMAEHFPLGPGSASPASARRRHLSADKLARNAGELQQVEHDLAYYQARLEGVQAGELHPNGQRRSDAPSRVRHAAACDIYSAYIHAHVKPGDRVELTCNGSLVLVERVSRRSVVIGGDKWECLDIVPLKADASKHTPAEFARVVAAWARTQSLSC
jgi:hypothetical protein